MSFSSTTRTSRCLVEVSDLLISAAVAVPDNRLVEIIPNGIGCLTFFSVESEYLEWAHRERVQQD